MKINYTLINHIKYCFVVLIILLNFTSSNCQTHRVFNLNTDKYPILSINFSNYSNSKIDINNIRIFENNSQAKIIELNPGTSLISPTSLTIVLDISASMRGNQLRILKDATKEFINLLPLEICEIALATFNGQIQLDCDFTHNKQRLFNTIENIKAEGGTNYNVAFLESNIGIIDISKQAKYRKHVIFFTDGLSTIQTQKVISAAINNNISINCVTINLEIPQSLINIAQETGGSYYEKLSQKREIKSIYNKIFDKIQNENHGFIKWEAINTCNTEVNLKIDINGIVNHLAYTIPKGDFGSIKTEPTSLYFTHKNLLKPEYSSLLISPNIPKITIVGIYSQDTSNFNFKNLDFPINIKQNESETIKFVYKPNNNLYTSNQYTIVTKECPDIKINAYGGSKNKLEITSPSNGDTLITGSETIISWQGVSKNTNVNLFYSQENNQKWITIGKDQAFNFNWHVPSDTGSLVRIKATCANELNYNSINNAKLILNGNAHFKSASYNENGSEIITSTINGDIESWKRSSGKKVHNFEKLFQGNAIFYPELNRAITFSNNQLNLFTNRNGKYIGSYCTYNKKLRSSLLTWHGKEYYSSVSEIKNSILWDPIQNRQIFSPNFRSIKEAAIGQNKEFAAILTNNKIYIWNVKKNKKWRSLKFNNRFESGVFHQNRDILSINYNDKVVVYDLSKKKKFKIEDERFSRYSPTGKYIITMDSCKHYLYSLLTWERALSFDKPDFYYFSENEELLVAKENKIIKVINIDDNKIVFEDTIAECKDVKFFPKSDDLLIITDRYVHIINYKTDSLIYSLNYQKGFVSDIEISPDGEELLIISENNVFVWAPIDLKEDTVSDYFTIISPSPANKDSLYFSKQLINTQKEIIFANFLINNSNYPLTIKKIFFDDTVHDEFYIISNNKNFTIPPKTSHNIELGFKPTSIGNKNGILNIVTPTDTLRSFVFGVGVSLNKVHLTKEIDFGKIPSKSVKDTIVPLFINQNDTVVLIESVNISKTHDSDFELLGKTPNNLISKNDTLWLKIRFKPEVRGRMNTFLNIKIKGFDTPFKCKLFAESIAKRSIIITGKTINSSNNKPMYAMVLCTDLLSRNTLIKTQSDKNGFFSFALNTDRNYSLVAESPNFISSSVNLDLIAPQFQDTLFKDIILTPIASKSFISLNNVFFETGSAELNELSIPDLNRISDFLQSNKDITIEIHGHTDNQGNPDNNLILSKFRALAVRKYFIKQGIIETRLTIQYFGETQPKTLNTTKKGRQINRRVEIKIN